MKELTSTNFGLLIAYLIPGFAALLGVSAFSPTLQRWLSTVPPDAPTIGGFLYVTLASVAAGLAVSTIRWAVIDFLHHVTGLRRPRWDFSKLEAHIGAFEVLVESHYRYYQFYGNMIIALVIADVSWRVGNPASVRLWQEVAVVIAIVMFAMGSRDALRKYYERGSHLLCKSL